MNAPYSLLATFGLLALAIPPAFAETVYAPGIWNSYADGTEYQSTISRDLVVSSPSWSIGKPLPISLERALEIAIAEHRKIVKKPEQWSYRSMTLERLRGTNPENWYFVVSFEQDARPEDFTPTFRLGVIKVLVDFSGRPGTIKAKGKGG
jgi:hypothetical protein